MPIHPAPYLSRGAAILERPLQHGSFRQLRRREVEPVPASAKELAYIMKFLWPIENVPGHGSCIG
jgi:hypothetical protein